jgi:nitrile hydratase
MFWVVAALSDMGGRTEYFGPIVREANEPVFHARWEGRVFGISPFVFALFGANTDATRFAMEQLPREVYMSSYYQRWLGAFEGMLVRAGYLGPAEVDARVEGRQADPGKRRVSRLRLAVTSAVVRSYLRPTLPRWLCAHVLPRMIGTSRPALRSRRFSVGDRIRVRGERASGHTRQPGYVTGKPGVITAHHGATVFPDAHAVHRRARPQHLYTVAFAGSDLWGDAADAGSEVRVDLFEAYLEPA